MPVRPRVSRLALRLARPLPAVQRAQEERRELRRQVRRLAAEVARLEAEAADRLRREEARATAERERAAAAKRAPQPSYRYKLFESQRRDSALRRVHGARDTVWSVNGKPEGRAFARSLGLRVPATLATAPTIDALDLDALPERFVVKPLGGAGGVGVMPLLRTEAGFRDLTRGTLRSAEEVRARYARSVAGGGITAEVEVEELLQEPRLPDLVAPDWKVFCFGAEVGLVMQRVVRPGRGGRQEIVFKYWDDRWRVLENAREETVVDDSLPPPLHPDELLAAARAVSARFVRPHLRVDLYDVAEGVVFGEVTPQPGPPMVMTPRIDLVMGRLWERVETERFFGPLTRPPERP